MKIFFYYSCHKRFLLNNFSVYVCTCIAHCCEFFFRKSRFSRWGKKILLHTFNLKHCTFLFKLHFLLFLCIHAYNIHKHMMMYNNDDDGMEIVYNNKKIKWDKYFIFPLILLFGRFVIIPFFARVILFNSLSSSSFLSACVIHIFSSTHFFIFFSLFI